MQHAPSRARDELADAARGALVYNARVAHSFLRLTTGEHVAKARRLAEHLGLLLLILAIGTLLFRPADLLPGLAGAPIYEILVVACLVLSFPRLLATWSLRALKANAIAVLLLLLVPAVMLSHLVQGNLYDARLGGLEMLKALVFFFLILALVDSLTKLRAVLAVMTVSVLAVTVLAVLQYHAFIHLPSLQLVMQTSSDGGPALARLCGIGVFNDPNDFSMILVVAAAACAYGMGERQLGWTRWTLLAPLALFGYALLLTHSRGGMVASVGGLVAFFSAKIGWRNTIPILCLMAPLLLIPMWGRQTNVNLDDPNDTFQARLGLWSDTLEVFRSAPFFGIGQGRLVESIGQVAHNSYMHAFGELGLLGGIAFTGAVYLSVRGVQYAKPSHPALCRMQPYMFAIVVCYATGLLSLSRCYTVPTQLIFGLAAVYLVLASRDGGRPAPAWNWASVGRCAAIGVLMLVSTHIVVQAMVHRG